MKIKIIISLILQGLALSLFATKSDVVKPITRDRYQEPRRMKDVSIPTWNYKKETMSVAPEWMSKNNNFDPDNDIHPLRELGGTVVCNGYNYLRKDGVSADQVILHDAVCDLKTIVPSPFKEDFKILDVGYYTLVTSLYNQDKIKKYLWEEQIKIYETANPNKPYCIIAKQFTDKATYASFKIGLKLPRTGFFVKMNDMVERGIETLILTTIETEYNKKFDITSAEVAGIKKLKELLGKIDNLTSISEELLKLNGFEPIPFQAGTNVLLTRTGSQLIDNTIKDYCGLKISNDFIRDQAKAGILANETEYTGFTLASIFTDNENYTSNNGIDFQKATSDFGSINKTLVVWWHWFIPLNGTTPSLFYKVKNNIPQAQAEKFVRDNWDKKMADAQEGIGNIDGTDTANKMVNCDINSKWRTKTCFMPEICSLTQGFYGSVLNGVFDFGLYGGLYCGLIDGLLDTTSFFWELGVGLNEVLNHIPFSTQWFVNACTKIIQEGGIWNGLMKKLDADKDYWFKFKNGFMLLANTLLTAEGRTKLKNDIATELNYWFDQILGNQGNCWAGYRIGRIGFEVLFFWATGGFSAVANAARNIANFTKEALQILAKGSFREALNVAKNVGIKSFQFLKCKLLGKGCFVAGTPVMLAGLGFMPIEKLQLGNAVLANSYVTSGYQANVRDNKLYYTTNADAQPDDELTSDEQKQVDATPLNDTDWYSINLEMKKQDGSVSHIKLLRPKWWLQKHKIQQPNGVIYLNMPEMGLDGIAQITLIAKFDNSKSLEGSNSDDKTYSTQLITGLFEHQSSDVWLIGFDNEEVLGVTSIHPIYSLDRHQFVAAADLKINERVLAKDKILSVSSLSLSASTKSVYNLEVRNKHNFLVGNKGIVVHNSYIFSCAWSALRSYGGGITESALDHIKRLHLHSSGVLGKSRFASHINNTNIENILETALTDFVNNAANMRFQADRYSPGFHHILVDMSVHPTLLNSTGHIGTYVRPGVVQDVTHILITVNNDMQIINAFPSELIFSTF